MDWLWRSNRKPKDSTADLDPTLRDFLNKETARRQAEVQQSQAQSSPDQQASEARKSYRSELGLEVPGVHHLDQNKPAAKIERPAVPEQSLFQDGRYAHLWKTYRTPEELEASSATDQDKLTAITKNFKDRKAAIGRAAIENCAFEQMTLQECFLKGTWAQLSTMCKEDNKAFNRCYNMQARFLKALGYMSAPRSDEAEERIQAHADKLYQEMLKREKDLKEAKEAGKPTEPLPPLIVAEETAKALGPDSAWAKMREDAVARGDKFTLAGNFTKEQQAKIMANMRNLTDEEKALELQLLAAESRVRRDLLAQVDGWYRDERESRKKRLEEGNETIGDKIKRFSGWTT